MIIRGIKIDFALKNYPLWQIIGFIIGGLSVIVNGWLFCEFLLIADPLDSNIADFYLSIVEMFYTMGFIMDGTEILVKVLIGQLKIFIKKPTIS